MYVIRVSRERAGVVEAVHEIRVAGHGRRGSAGDGDSRRHHLRSAAKPVQALACVVSGAADRFGFTARDLALVAASHSGEPVHVETAASILTKSESRVDELRCGAHAPVHAESATALTTAGIEPTALHNNCSGKHGGMLAACVAWGHPKSDYVAPDHPVQRFITREIARFSGVDDADIVVGVDGCSAPVFAIPLGGAARMYWALAAPQRASLPADVAAAASRIVEAMRTAPELVGGTGRIDTDVGRASGGRIVTKVGAMGLWCLAVPELELGLALKARDGHGAPVYRAGLALLRELGLLDDDAWAQLLPHHDSVRRNRRDIDVGRVIVDLPPGLAESLRAVCGEPSS